MQGVAVRIGEESGCGSKRVAREVTIAERRRGKRRGGGCSSLAAKDAKGGTQEVALHESRHEAEADLEATLASRARVAYIASLSLSRNLHVKPPSLYS